jgi:hypothetical protein
VAKLEKELTAAQTKCDCYDQLKVPTLIAHWRFVDDINWTTVSICKSRKIVIDEIYSVAAVRYWSSCGRLKLHGCIQYCVSR